jgi:hypothetical protein
MTAVHWNTWSATRCTEVHDYCYTVKQARSKENATANQSSQSSSTGQGSATSRHATRRGPTLKLLGEAAKLVTVRSTHFMKRRVGKRAEAKDKWDAGS